MTTLSGFMTGDHRSCDEQLAEAERLVQRGDWTAAAAAWAGFEAAMRRHLAREEDALFPAFERSTGNTGGPTAVMRMEHEQMRALFPQISGAIAARDARQLLGLSETLMVLIQQHNMKEEQVLYPMCDQVVEDAPALLAEIEALEG